MSSDNSTPVLALDHVTVIRRGRHTVDDVTFAVNAGEQWAVLGPNGAGKSTLLAVAATATWPSRGRVYLFGEELGRAEVPHLRQHIGYVTAHHLLEWPLTAREVVTTAITNTVELPMRWSPSPEQARRVDAQLASFGLTDVADTTWRGLSQGELGRTLLARAMLHEPRLLLLDEPAAGLDLGAREQLLDVIAEHVAKVPGLASITVTHHLEELAVTTTHAALMRRGRMIAQGPIEAVLTSEAMSEAFGFGVSVSRVSGRWFATRVR